MQQPETNRELSHERSVEELLRRAQAGDHQALAELFEPFRDRILRIARVRIGTRLATRVDPEDIVQMTLVNAWQHLGTFDASKPHLLVNWFAVIAENCIRDEVKKGRSGKRDVNLEVQIETLRPNGGSTVAIPIPGPSGTPSQYVSAQETAEIYDRCLSELPEHYREIILLRQHADMSWIQVAERLNSPNAKAAVQLHFRAMECLKEKLEAEGF